MRLPWVVTGSEDGNWPQSSYDEMTLSADYMEAVGASHWGLVLNRRQLPDLSSRVTNWLNANLDLSS